MGAKAGSKTDPPKSTTRLGDWYANALVINRQQLVLAVSGITLLPVVLPASPFKTVPVRLADAVEEILQTLAVDRAKIASEKDAMFECTLAMTQNRQVLGSMNDFKNMLPFHLEGHSLLRASLTLAESPCSPIEMESPRRATLKLFSGRSGES